MGDPVSAFALVSMAGGALGAVGSQYSAQGQAEAQEFNAKVADRNAALAREAADYNAMLLERQSRKIIGSIRANAGASGGSGADGSLFDILADSARAAEMDRQQTLYQGELRALGYEDSARLSRMGAQSAKTAGMFGSISSLITGFSGGMKLAKIGGAEASAGAKASAGANASAGTPIATK